MAAAVPGYLRTIRLEACGRSVRQACWRGAKGMRSGEYIAGVGCDCWLMFVWRWWSCVRSVVGVTRAICLRCLCWLPVSAEISQPRPVCLTDKRPKTEQYTLPYAVPLLSPKTSAPNQRASLVAACKPEGEGFGAMCARFRLLLSTSVQRTAYVLVSVFVLGPPRPVLQPQTPV